jgi:hypothetical protein
VAASASVLDNSKSNADHLLDLIVEASKRVQSRLGRDQRKPSSRPAANQMLDELAKEADLVISAMAD